MLIYYKKCSYINIRNKKIIFSKKMFLYPTLTTAHLIACKNFKHSVPTWRFKCSLSANGDAICHILLALLNNDRMRDAIR